MMKRETLQQAIFTLFLMILMPVSAWASFRFFPEWNGFVASGVSTVLAIASYFVGRGRNIGYLLCTFFNTVGAGCAVGAFYHYQAPFPGMKELWLVVAIWTAFLLLYLLGMNLKASPLLTVIAFFLWLAGMVVSVVFWCMDAGPWWSFSFYVSLCVGFWSAVVYADTMVQDDSEKGSVWQIFGLLSFGAYFLVVLVVALVLSEGDCCDGDCCCEGADCCPGKPAKRSSKPPMHMR